MKLCLYCYKPLNPEERDFHPACSKKFFGRPQPPVLPYSEKDLDELALQVVRSHVTITGVQPKLSLHLEKAAERGRPQRLTIVGLWGNYILKPPTPQYQQLPEIEDLTMHLASLARIKTVPHSLIRMKSGSLAYITKRIDRTKNGKLPMEDMCQVTEKLTEDKYYGSYEQIGKAILRYSVNPGLDVINFMEMVLFSFLTGNADMHLKNFSLINLANKGHSLTPAYDMIATALVNPQDTEDLALSLNGRKKRINRNDFLKAFDTLGINEKVKSNLFRKFEKTIPQWERFIDGSFLDKSLKHAYKKLIYEKVTALNLSL